MPQTSTFVSSDGEHYELQMGRWSRRLAPLFIRFAGIAGAAQIIDVGCGTGNLASCLALNQEIARVRGIDLSPAYISYANRVNKDPRVSFQVGDACELPFADASFDHALSMLTLQFIPQAERAVREMCRVTRRGGTVAAATWNTRGGFVALRMIYDTAAMVDPQGVEARRAAYTKPMSLPGDLARAWHAAGLTKVVEEMSTIRMDFASFMDFWVPMTGSEGPVAAYVGTLGEDVREKLKNAVKLAYLDGEPDGARSHAATAWVVKGEVP